MSQVIIDVREQDEYDAEHVPDSVWIPLSQFPRLAPGILQTLAGRELLLMCRSGKRAQLAQTQVRQFGFGGQLQTQVFAGGILEWKRLGKPMVGGRGCRLPVLRQVQLVVGPAVLAGALASLWVDRRLAWVAAFFGAGLTLAGLTGFCPLASLLASMPWNRPAAR